MQFKDVIGQADLKKNLINSVVNNKISHAQLFSGNEGSGHFPLALAYAQFVLCKQPTDSDSCGECLSCKKIDQYAHPDVHFSFPIHLSKTNKVNTSDDVLQEFREMLINHAYIGLQEWYQVMGNENKQGIIAVQESQAIIKKLSLKSYEGGFKTLIMWLPETMNLTAANKLLKLIEEPPQKTLFLLVSDFPDKIITTILSRVQYINVPKLGKDEIKKQLLSKYSLNDIDAEHYAKLSDGNFHKSTGLIKNKEETQQHLAEFISWMRLCYTKNISETINWVDGFNSYGREKQKDFLIFCLEMFRQCIIGHYTGNKLITLSNEQSQFLNKFSPFIHHRNIVDLNELINKAHYHLERNANPKILFLDISIKIFSLLKK